MLREDGTGAIEYFYGKMGEVTKTRRTLIVPNQAIATYVTQWTYDSHNRLLEMIYPDEDKITYSYNLGGQLEKVHGYKSYGYDYVSKIGYDKFEQRTYITEQLQIISHSRGSAFFFPQAHRKPFGWKATTARCPCWFPRLPCSCPPLAALELYVNKTTITAIKLLILRSFQRKGLCNSGLKAKSTTFVNNIKTEYNGRKQYNSR